VLQRVRPARAARALRPQRVSPPDRERQSSDEEARALPDDPVRDRPSTAIGGIPVGHARSVGAGIGTRTCSFGPHARAWSCSTPSGRRHALRRRLCGLRAAAAGDSGNRDPEPAGRPDSLELHSQSFLHDVPPYRYQSGRKVIRAWSKPNEPSGLTSTWVVGNRRACPPLTRSTTPWMATLT
jgi:hypothetical protein